MDELKQLLKNWVLTQLIIKALFVVVVLFVGWEVVVGSGLDIQVRVNPVVVDHGE